MISNFFKSEIGAVWQHHRLFLLVLLIGGLLRFWQLPTHMIFFGDAGRDFLEAVEMIKTNKPPLLGIPSSVPRFRQGPVTIWIVGATMLLLGNHPVVIGTIFASLSCITLILLYFLLEEQVNKVVALTASLIFAVSPLAVAHARMPYHISPIPLFTILYLYSLVKLWQHPTPKRIFLATLAWTLLFQFELAVFPLLLLVPYVIFKQAKLKISNLKSFTPALLIGLFPQLIYDLSNRFEHLGGFAVWMVYRIVALAGYGGEHTIGFDRVVNTLEIFSLYFGRILFVEANMITKIVLVGILGSGFVIGKNWKNLPPMIHLTAVSFGLLSVAYFVHGSPSEAYFPPFLIFIPILIAFAIFRLSKNYQLILSLLLLLLSLINIWQIGQNNFFVQPTTSAFNYGPSLNEQISVIQYIKNQVGNKSFALYSTDGGSRFSSYLDNYRYVSHWLDLNENQDAAEHIFFIQYGGNDLAHYPNAKIVHFYSVTLVQIR